MARWAPCKRKAFITKLIALGFSPPEPGGSHHYMRYGAYTLTLPSNSDYSVNQVKMLIREIEPALGRRIPLKEWLSL